jgi:hypothetical protein
MLKHQFMITLLALLSLFCISPVVANAQNDPYARATEIWWLEDTVGNDWTIQLSSSEIRDIFEWNPVPTGERPAIKFTVEEAKEQIEKFVVKGEHELFDSNIKNIKKNIPSSIDHYDRVELIPINKKRSKWVYVFHFYSKERANYYVAVAKKKEKYTLLFAIPQ